MLRTLLLLTALIGPFCLIAQNAQDTPQLNRAILRFYDTDRMIALLSDESRKQKALFYFTQSFAVEMLSCAECPVNYDQLYNYDLFNVRDFEHLRNAQEPVVINYRDLYSIKLHPVSYVEEQLGGMGFYELVHGFPFRELPVWVTTDNFETDFSNYKEEVKTWAADFPHEYDGVLRSAEVKKIRYAEFAGLTHAGRTGLISGYESYIIVDDEMLNF